MAELDEAEQVTLAEGDVLEKTRGKALRLAGAGARWRRRSATGRSSRR